LPEPQSQRPRPALRDGLGTDLLRPTSSLIPAPAPRRAPPSIVSRILSPRLGEEVNTAAFLERAHFFDAEGIRVGRVFPDNRVTMLDTTARTAIACRSLGLEHTRTVPQHL